MLGEGLKSILCIGESKDEYEAGLNKEVRHTSWYLQYVGVLRFCARNAKDDLRT